MDKKSKQFETLQNYSADKFRRLTGVNRSTFDTMFEILDAAQQKGGRFNKLSVSDMLLIALEYLRQYPSYLCLGINFGLSESVAYKIVKWVANTLVKSEKFRLSGKNSLVSADSVIEVFLIDVPQSPIERPQKQQQELCYSGKKKRHTIKSQERG